MASLGSEQSHHVPARAQMKARKGRSQPESATARSLPKKVLRRSMSRVISPSPQGTDDFFSFAEALAGKEKPSADDIKAGKKL